MPLRPDVAWPTAIFYPPDSLQTRSRSSTSTAVASSERGGSGTSTPSERSSQLCCEHPAGRVKLVTKDPNCCVALEEEPAEEKDDPIYASFLDVFCTAQDRY